VASWAKIKFFWSTMLGSAGSTLTATSTASGYDVANIYNMLETNMWKSASAADQAVHYDAGAGNAFSADYLVILGHNLGTIGASVLLQASATGAFAGEQTDVVNEAITADTVYLREFTSPGALRYWRLSLIGMSAAPYMTLCIWGDKTELDYASSSFDPNAEEVKAAVNLSQGGYVTGVHTRYTERSMRLRFNDADSTLYAKVKAWWDGSGLKNFFVAWENVNNQNDIFLMRPSATFNNPLVRGGAYRDITINLKGRKAT